MKKQIFLTLLVLFSILFSGNSFGQKKYWIVFTDKQDVSFNPYTYFDQRTIEKRAKAGISLVQFSDLPLNADYCEIIEEYGEITTESRWLNAVAVSLKASDLKNIRELPIVKEIVAIQNMELADYKRSEDISPEELIHINKQLEVFGGDLFLENNIDGKGVRIAVFDGGFPGVDTHDMFSHIRDDGRIIASYDFVNKDEFVYDFNSHGTSVLACIAGKLDSTRFGLGTGAEFLLARTEVNPEIFEEEENWAAAMEWADKNGADIISSSLGYTHDRYFPKQMDGETVFVTRMANLAAKKGMLVVNAAGNDGDKDWEVIGAPADADSVLTVGGVDPGTLVHVDFSSYGPTFDGRMKPNVVAFGEVITAGKKSIKRAFGTSFSAPLVSGFAACIMQIQPEWGNMKVFDEIQKSGHLYPYYDYAHGFGIPQASYFINKKEYIEETFKIVEYLDDIEIKLIISDSDSGKDIPEKDFGQPIDDNYLYYHIADKETGKIRKYAVVNMSTSDVFSISLDELQEGELVKAHYNGFTNEYIF
ncbi:MAG: S8 family serine peptidase [Bacteroidales bacterium]|nr:S8 family serine peptidase [Bacteroidales bacterium]